MKAMVLENICRVDDNPTPLKLLDLPEPELGPRDVLIKVTRCGVCHTELDEIEGRTPPPRFPVVLGHEVVGKVVDRGHLVRKFNPGDRLGVGWIHSSCGECSFCLGGNENLCSQFRATGRDVNGGYAEFMAVGEDFAHTIPDFFSDSEAAPLFCAGAIGYRSLRLTGLKNGQALGLTGFGASAHLVLMMVRHVYPESPVFVFARSGKERAFALELGAVWAGDTSDQAPERLDAVIDTTPAWKPVVEALSNLKPGGRLVINAIRKENKDNHQLTRLDYPQHLWMEKEIKSVANVARSDITHFIDLAARIPIKPELAEYPLEEANSALVELKERKIRGAKVLVIDNTC